MLLDRSDGCSGSIDHVFDTLAPYGLTNAVSILAADGLTTGLSRQETLKRVAEADALINVNGFIDSPDILERARRRVFFDIDPGFPQMWHELGLADLLYGHDDFVTIALNMGESDCAIPTCGRTWITTVQPIALDYWQPQVGGDSYTTVASWRGPFEAIEWKGERYGLRAHEFRKFAGLPNAVDVPLGLALDIHPGDHVDKTLLESNGWRLQSATAASSSPEIYHDFIGRSRAEFGVAKEIYVKARSGWFSDRTVCYLASGKPVVVQDTAAKKHLPSGDGLMTFATLDEAIADIESVEADYTRHCRAAREIAEEVFDSRRVLTKLLENLDLM